MRTFVIDGKFLGQATTGTQRYAREMVASLDRIAPPGMLTLLTPHHLRQSAEELGLTKIALDFATRLRGQAWTNIALPRYCRLKNSTPLSLCNNAPLLARSVVVLHDVSPIANPAYYSFRYRQLARAAAQINSASARAVVTVSNFSKSEIGRYIPSARGKIRVVPGSWQHVTRVNPDLGLLESHPELRARGFYFTLSSLAPNKNLQWIVETAQANPSRMIAVGGGCNAKVFGKQRLPELPNLVYLGYITDEQIIALMQQCLGFLFPTFYEGFGLPPMEALACGARVAVSDTPCMREVYRDSVLYFDPRVPSHDLQSLFSSKVASPEMVLSQYSWSNSAEKLLSLLQGLP